MDELKSRLSALAGFVGRMSASQALILLGVIAGVIVGTVALTSFLSSANYTVLYSGMEPGSASEVTAYLDENHIPYEITDGGRTISTPDDKVYKTRMALAAQGLPSGGPAGYSIFDQTNFGMTDFLQQVNYKRALEGELTRSIMEIREVRAARVHIVIPKDRLFAKDKKEPTASILLKLTTSNLTPGQLAGIKHLVASSVEGLSTDNISIIDYNGNLLSEEKQRDALAGLSSTQLQVRKEVERYLEEKAQSMLDNVIGDGKSVVRISADLDFTQVERTNELYDANGAVVRSEETTEQSTNSVDKTPEPTAESKDDSKNSTTVTNYEIPKTVERIVNSVGVINRLSIAVMVDGVQATTTDASGATTTTYNPRPTDEIDRLSSLVKSAVGYDQNRNDQIEVYNIAFDHDNLQTEQEALDGMYDSYFVMNLVKQIGFWALIIVLVLYLRKKLSSFFKGLKTIMPAPTAAQQHKNAQSIKDEIAHIESEMRKPKLLDQMQETAKERPDELAKVIKTMMVGSSE